jgi:uncharacterized protein
MVEDATEDRSKRPTEAGAPWEKKTVDEVFKSLCADEVSYSPTYPEAEIDLGLFKHSHRIGIECKRMDAPALTPSMRIALNDLKLDRLVVVYLVDQRYPLADGVEVIPLVQLISDGDIAKSLFRKPRPHYFAGR